jgi:hypothetical protein
MHGRYAKGAAEKRRRRMILPCSLYGKQGTMQAVDTLVRRDSNDFSNAQKVADRRACITSFAFRLRDHSGHTRCSSSSSRCRSHRG